MTPADASTTPSASTVWRTLGERSAVLCPLLIVVTGFVIYLNALDAPFVFDDKLQVERNMGIRTSDGLGRIVFEDARPMVGLTLALNYAIGELSVTGYHVLNIVVHVSAALALYVLVAQTMAFAGESDPRVRRAGALAVALLWVTHPLGSEAVTYTIQRSESMMTLGFLLALVAAGRQWRAISRAASIAWTIAAIAAMVFGAASKQIIVVLPVVLILYDWVFLRPVSFRTWLAKRAGVLAGFTLVAVWLCWRLVDVVTSTHDASVGMNVEGVTPAGYLLSQPGVIAHYLRLSVWPHPLVIDYAWPVVTSGEIVARAAGQTAAMLVLIGWSVYGLLRRRWWGFCGAAFFVILSPTSSVVPVKDLAVEHRMYLPLACGAAVAVFGVGALLRRGLPDRWPLAAAVILACAILSLGVRTVVRNADYVDVERLWRGAAEVNPDNARAWINLGQHLNSVGRPGEAIGCYERALEIEPASALAYNNLGSALTAVGRPDAAIACHQRAIEISPSMSLAYNNLGVALTRLGRFDEAQSAYREAIRIDASCQPAYYNLANYLLREQRYDEAIDLYRKAIALTPSDDNALRNLGVALASSGRPNEALDQYRLAAELTPTNPDNWVNMAYAYRDLGRFDEAREAGLHAIELIRARGDVALARELEGDFMQRITTPPQENTGE